MVGLKRPDICPKIALGGVTGGMNIGRGFDTILGWHNNKTNGRPTIVNMSWGLGRTFTGILGGEYRGTLDRKPPEIPKGMVGRFTFSG